MAFWLNHISVVMLVSLYISSTFMTCDFCFILVLFEELCLSIFLSFFVSFCVWHVHSFITLLFYVSSQIHKMCNASRSETQAARSSIKSGSPRMLSVWYIICRLRAGEEQAGLLGAVWIKTVHICIVGGGSFLSYSTMPDFLRSHWNKPKIHSSTSTSPEYADLWNPTKHLLCTGC